MLRFWYVIIISLPYIIYYLAKGSYIEKNTERYSEADRYRVALHVIHVMKRNGYIEVVAHTSISSHSIASVSMLA